MRLWEAACQQVMVSAKGTTRTRFPLVPKSFEVSRRQNQMAVGLNVFLFIDFLGHRIIIQLVNMYLELHRIQLMNVRLLSRRLAGPRLLDVAKDGVLWVKA